MEQLKKMKECLIGMVEGQVYGNLDKVDANELGEAIDMIKDLAEAIYYCTITDAMEGGAESKKRHHYPKEMAYGDWDEPETHYYSDKNIPMPKREPAHPNPMPHDPKEGRSGLRRKMYMEGKGMKDKAYQMQELDVYMQELAADMTEMIQDASPEEKQLLQAKIANLAAKIK